MPVIGLGTWQSPVEKVKDAVRISLDLGYRAVDTAWSYKNETAIGEALEEYFESGSLKREDVFITTKLPWHHMNPKDLQSSLEDSLKKLQLDYVDLYLIHTPCSLKNKGDSELLPRDENGKLEIEHTDLVQTWSAMEALVEQGKTRSIGLSNFNSAQIERILENSQIKPVMNQVECHAYMQQKELQKFCESRGIKLTSYASLGSPGRPESLKDDSHKVLLEDPVIYQIAEKYNKTPAQVLLRNLVQRGIFVIPKSVTQARIEENFKIFDFQLTDEDMKVIASLDQKTRMFALHVMTEHPEYPYHIPF
ncbi:hypothetical protein CHS0354_020526 [Potamilus streckersoni]|uniref:NADP-dependent oxidoreductase domain-containing protein n=1 Tax=Potamilus streckersoni TaxID=2493646 RepID=A0AAE0SR04_9BIVA|nr:hypothetical protein CHS0354_020526 [Potamilus streckersoni]